MSNNNLYNVFLSLIVTLLILLSTAVSATPVGDNIIISEIEYDPATPPPPNTSFDVENEGEWFELYNPTANAIDVGGWTIKEGNTPTYTFPSPTIITAGDYLLVTNRTDRFQLNYPTITPDLQMNPTGAGLLRLNNTGDELTLRNTTDDIVDFVAWENFVTGWPAAAVDGPICRTLNTDTDNMTTDGSGNLIDDWADCSNAATPGFGPGFTISKSSSSITEGDIDTFTVVLTAQPFMNVVIDLATSDLGAASLSTSSLTFDNTNWDIPQTVTISAVEDDTDLFDENVTVTASVNDSLSDNSFDSLINQTLAVSIADNDLAQISIDDVSQNEADSGNTDYSFTISIDYPSPNEITVDYATADSTALLSDTDYVAVTSTLATIAAGDLSTTIVVKSIGDNKVESDEVFVVDLSNATNANILDGQGEATIENNDSAQLSINNVSQTEADTGILAYTFTISTDNPSDTNITVDFATADSTASSADADYIQVLATQAVIAADTLSTTVVVQVPGDNKVESDEVFLVNLSNPTIASILDGQGIGTILNNDSAQLSINDVSQLETDSGTLNYVFTISSNNPSDTNITVDYATADASATSADLDYLAVSTSPAVISAGNLSTTVVVSVNGDNKVESDETFTVNLSNPTIASIVDGQGVGTIRNDDSAQLSINDVSQLESDSGTLSYTFTISTNNPSDTNITVDYATADASATSADSDYLAVSTTPIVISAGNLSTTVVVSVSGDNKVESDETFTVNLSNPTIASIVDGQGIGTIRNDDSAQLSINDVSQLESDSGTINYTFTVSTDNPSDSDITFDYVTADGTATVVDNDYISILNTSTRIPVGALSTNIVIQVVADNEVESDENFFVNLTNSTVATLLDPRGIGTIQNDDGAQLSIDDVTETEADSGNTSYIFSISTDNPSATDITVDYSVADATATIADSDYLFIPPAQAVISAGELSTTLIVESVGDLKVEGDETFSVNLSNPSGATILKSAGVATIINNDDAGFFVSPTTRIIDEGNSSDFSVVLTSQPSNNVVVDLISDDNSAATVSPVRLVFTNLNWNIPQTISITAPEDADLNNENVILTASINTPLSDDFFDTLTSQTVDVSVIDDDSDTDFDGVPDEDDLDKDNDGNPDITDPRPLAPTAVGESFDAQEGSLTVFNILNNDDFLPASTISITDTGNGTAAGSVIFNPLTGELEYTPTSAEVGFNVTIEYRVCNTAVSPEVCALAVVSILVNARPIAAPIPTLSEWMLVLLSLLLVTVAMRQKSIRF